MQSTEDKDLQKIDELMAPYALSEFARTLMQMGKLTGAVPEDVADHITSDPNFMRTTMAYLQDIKDSMIRWSRDKIFEKDRTITEYMRAMAHILDVTNTKNEKEMREKTRSLQEQLGAANEELRDLRKSQYEHMRKANDLAEANRTLQHKLRQAAKSEEAMQEQLERLEKELEKALE